jgi:hypothetical protein
LGNRDSNAEPVKRDQDYNLAKYGLATRQAGPIVDYFKKWGKEGVQLENIEFGGKTGDELIITYPGGKQEKWETDQTSTGVDKFLKGFMSLASPKVEKALYNKWTKEREEKRTQEAHQWKGEEHTKKMEGALSAKDKASIYVKLADAYDEEFPGGPPKGSEESHRDKWIENQFQKITGQKWGGTQAIPTKDGKATDLVARPEEQQGEAKGVPAKDIKGQEAPQEKPTVDAYDGKPHKAQDGNYYQYDKEKKKFMKLGKEDPGMGKGVTKKMPERPGAKPAISAYEPSPGTTEEKPEVKKEESTITYTDPKTGKTTIRYMDKKGNIRTEEKGGGESDNDKESKKKRKKKKKKKGKA